MTPGINTLLFSTGALGSFTCSGMTLLIYMGPTALRGIRATGDTLSNVDSQVFTPYKFGSTAGDRTPDLLTTRPTCYHSATALCIYCKCLHIHVYLADSITVTHVFSTDNINGLATRGYILLYMYIHGPLLLDNNATSRHIYRHFIMVSDHY